MFPIHHPVDVVAVGAEYVQNSSLSMIDIFNSANIILKIINTNFFQKKIIFLSIA